MDKIYDLVETRERSEAYAAPNFDHKILSSEARPEPKLAREREDVDVSCFVLLVDSEELGVKDGSFTLDIMGNAMFEYVARACPKPPACLRYNEENNLIQLIRPYLKNTEYTLVLYSDTPLVTKSNVLNILDFAKRKGLNVCKLTRGWVFKNEYIKRVDEIYAPSTYYFEEEDFMVAKTYKQLYIISQTLKNRIISYHMRQGVYFKDPDTTYVEANVSIGKGTVVESFVSLSKDTVIEENAFIGSRSTLKNAKVYEGASIEGAYIDGGIVMKDAKVKNGAKIFSQTAIKEGAVVGEECIISNAIIGSHSMVDKNTTINYLNCANDVSIGAACSINGASDKAIVIEEGATVGDFVTLLPGAKIAKNQKINYAGKRE